jgi:EF hand
MKKIQTLLIAAMFTTASTAFADHDGMGEHCKMHSKVTFEQADKDKDGTLDREEAKVVCGEKFEVMDTDKDGTLTKEELNVCGRKKNNAHDKLHEKRSKEFAAADKDGDGTLTKSEAKKLNKVHKNFDVIDADKDGTVSRDEVHDFMHKTK